jgi:hypothetical protein
MFWPVTTPDANKLRSALCLGGVLGKGEKAQSHKNFSPLYHTVIKNKCKIIFLSEMLISALRPTKGIEVYRQKYNRNLLDV